MEKLNSGYLVEDPSSVMFQYFDKDFWDSNVTIQQESGQQDMISRVTGMQVVVLHDPTMFEESEIFNDSEDESIEAPKRGRKKKTDNDTEL